MKVLPVKNVALDITVIQIAIVSYSDCNCRLSRLDMKVFPVKIVALHIKVIQNVIFSYPDCNQRLSIL